MATAGVGAPVVSAAEDGTSLVASVLAVLAPVLLLVLAVLLGVVVVRWGRGRRPRDDGRPTCRARC